MTKVSAESLAALQAGCRADRLPTTPSRSRRPGCRPTKLTCWSARWLLPLDRVGIYVPGGKATYPSSVLMNAVPAKVAGVGEIIMVVPMPGGEVNPNVLAAARIAGVDRIFKIGGAQAVAATGLRDRIGARASTRLPGRVTSTLLPPNSWSSVRSIST